MPPWVHVIVVIAISLYFIFRYIKDRFFYELLFVIWAPSTLLTYILTDETLIRLLGYFQIAMFIAVIFFMFKKRGQRRHSTLELLAKMAADQTIDEPNDNTPSLSTPTAPSQEEESEHKGEPDEKIQ